VRYIQKGFLEETALRVVGDIETMKRSIYFSMIVILLPITSLGFWRKDISREIDVGGNNHISIGNILNRQEIAEEKIFLPIAAKNFEDIDRSKYEGEDVFEFVNGSEPGMPYWDSEKQSFVPQENDNREEIILDEEFTVGENEEVVFENKIILIKPSKRKNIEIYGKLVINNCLLFWEQSQHQETEFAVNNGALLKVISSYSFSTNQYWVNWHYEDGATVYFDDFVGDPWTWMTGSVNYTAINYSTVKLTLDSSIHDAVIRIHNAHHVWLEILPKPGDYNISFPEERNWIYWDLPELWTNTDISITDSYFFNADITLSNDTHVNLVDSGATGIGWIITNYIDPDYVDCELIDLGDRISRGPKYYENKTWGLPCINSSFTLTRSILDGAWPLIGGKVVLKVYNSYLIDPRSYEGRMEIYDSVIDHVASYNKGEVYLENTQIAYDIEVYDIGSFIYGYNVTDLWPDRPFIINEINGGEYIKLNSPGPPW
jgi:hypothetical protein